MRDCLQVQTKMCHCTCIFPNTLISSVIIFLQPLLRLLLLSPLLMQRQILKTLCYTFETLQMVNSLCSEFMTAILLMMLFIMFHPLS